MPSVLFVCTANQFRSPLAAAYLLKNIPHEANAAKWTIESAGTWAKADLPVPKMTLQVAHQLGLDGLDRHRTRQIDQDLLNHFDLIIVMEAGQKEALSTEFPAVRNRLYLLSEIVDGAVYDISDPARPGVNPDEVGWELRFLINKGKGKILELAESLSKLPPA